MSHPNPGTEPAADLRQFAAVLWQMFVALQQAGFTERQALTVVGHTIQASLGGQS